MQPKFALLTGLVLCVSLSACQTTGGYKDVSDKLPALDVKLASAPWNGHTVPNEGICVDHGGKGFAPEIVVNNIPAEATAIIVEFSDRNYSPMNGGGHGVIGFPVKPGATSVKLPSIPGYTSELPDGIWVKSHNRSTGKGYRGPCSGGRHNIYEADIKAVQEPQKQGEEGKLFATGRVRLGTY
ncbi:MAG: hypothetical protein H7Y60_15450 [Rhodospirillaceae bacterium]|nr:hypothetical protein [Rhodospirillales bacterium]